MLPCGLVSPLAIPENPSEGILHLGVRHGARPVPGGWAGSARMRPDAPTTLSHRSVRPCDSVGFMYMLIKPGGKTVTSLSS